MHNPIARPGEEDADVWREIREWFLALAEAVFWILVVGLVSGSVVALVVLRYMATSGV